MKNLKISEIFYSLQGEGGRAGTPTVFIRTTGCKAQGACYVLGIKCDTEFESGKDYSVEDLLAWIKTNAPTCKEITWTGGEPLDQLNSEITLFFKELGFYQAIETSGLHPCVDNIDYICISPKVAEHVVKKNFKHVQELRYVRHKGQDIPVPGIKADRYYLSPHSDGYNINQENVNHCMRLCKENPTWRLSVQLHKIWNVL